MATAIVAAGALALPSFAAAGSTSEGGAVLEPITTSPAEALAFWTQTRREAAEPLPIVTLPPAAGEAAEGAATGAAGEAAQEAVAGTTGEGSAATTQEAASEGTSAEPLIASTFARTAALGGTEVTGSQSTVYPNNTNGKVYGVFENESFQCSGSLVAGNVVVTAGHCVIDPETGKRANLVIFLPGYNNGSKPYGGSFAVATGYSFTKSWEETAKKGSYANEGNDVAFLRMLTNVEKEVGASLKIAFDQPCNQTYTQYGYPGEEPYDGEVLYSRVSAYAGPDSNPYFSPTPMKIASDFTKGASGGPWTVGPTTSPTVLSLTAYGYENQPGYLFGPYFGEAARKAYELASKTTVPIGIEEICKPLEVPVPQPQPTPTPAPSAPPSEAAPAAPPVTLRVTQVRRRANGSAVLTAKVNAAGMLMLSGAAVRAGSVDAPAAGQYRLVVAPKGPANRRLRENGRTKVGVKVAFKASGKTKRILKKIQLSLRSVARPAQQRTSHSR